MHQYLVIHGIAVQHLANKLNEYAKEDWHVRALIEGPNELPLALLEREASQIYGQSCILCILTSRMEGRTMRITSIL